MVTPIGLLSARLRRRGKRPILEKYLLFQLDIPGGDGGIRTLDRPLQAYNGLANRRLQPLGHVSNTPGMPDTEAGRKRQNWGERISLHMKGFESDGCRGRIGR